MAPKNVSERNEEQPGKIRNEQQMSTNCESGEWSASRCVALLDTHMWLSSL